MGDQITPAELDKETIKCLLGNLSDQLCRARECAAKSGINFNLFEVLRIGRREVTTHSRLIAELLNPNGVHAQQTSFLELFLRQIGSDRIDVSTASVFTEYFIGSGRVDILISDANSKKIVIENKIDAGLGERQLQRYREKFPEENADIFYLTLKGSKPSEAISLSIKCISYEKDILEWLRACEKKSSDIPILKAAIAQYIRLVELLTDKAKGPAMNEFVLKEIFNSSKSLEAYFYMRELEGEILDGIVRPINERLRMAFAPNFELKTQLDGIGAKSESLTFSSPKLSKHNLVFGFEFDGTFYRKFLLGFKNTKKRNESPLIPFIKSEFEKFFCSNNPAVWWPIWSWADPRDWDLSKIYFDEKFIPRLEGYLKKLAEIAQSGIEQFEKTH